MSIARTETVRYDVRTYTLADGRTVADVVRVTAPTLTDAAGRRLWRREAEESSEVTILADVSPAELANLSAELANAMRYLVTP